MRLSLRPRNQRIRQGFTLVEMLVVAPIVIIVITGLVAAMVAMVGDALAANSRAVTAYDTQDALERIEQDVRIAVNFMDKFDYMTAPQGRDGDTGAFSFTDNKDLILTQQATTGSPYDSSRALVYYKDQPAGCSEDLSTNNTLNTRAIYYLRNGSLWRRSIVDAWNNNSVTDSDTVCGNPWQRDSCPLGSTMSTAPAATCNTTDEELLKNVTAFTPTFYTGNGSTTTNPLLASSVSVAVTISKSIGGETISQTSTIRAARRNDVPTDTTPPATPVITQYNTDIDTYNHPTLVSFQWTADKASRYTYQTSTDNTNWSSTTLTTNTWASVDVAYSGRPAYIRVTAYNDTGSSAVATKSFNSPTWANAGLQNAWTEWGGSTYYPTAAYTKTASGMVMLHGMVKGGTSNTVMFTLPSGLRPQQRLVFVASVGGTATPQAIINVRPNGEVIVVYANATTTEYTSLDNIRFLASDAQSTLGATAWTNARIGTWNNWSDYTTGEYLSTRWAMDNVGRVFVEGIVTGGGTAGNICNGCDLFQTPLAYRPDSTLLLPSTSNPYPYYSPIIVNPTQSDYTAIETRGMGSTNNINVANPIFYSISSPTTWTNITYKNSWVSFGAPFSDLSYSYRSDGIVTLRGVIKGGTATNGTVVGTLPASRAPGTRLIFVGAGIKTANALTDQVPVRIDVAANGDIIFNSNNLGSNKLVSVDGIMFYAGQ